ncbi:hypothetical protein VTK26DRAFT_6677 [Humicola hyalothermophila]
MEEHGSPGTCLCSGAGRRPIGPPIPSLSRAGGPEAVGILQRAMEGQRGTIAPIVKTFSNLLNSVHHPFAGARCSASPGSSACSLETR